MAFQKERELQQRLLWSHADEGWQLGSWTGDHVPSGAPVLERLIAQLWAVHDDSRPGLLQYQALSDLEACCCRGCATMPQPSMVTSWSSLPPYQVQACLPHSSLHIPGVLLPYAHCLHQAHAVSASVSMQMTAVLMMWKSCSPISGWTCASGTSHCWCACTLPMKGDIARSCSASLAPSLMSFCLCRLCRCLALSNAPQLRSASTRGLTSSRYAGVWQPA